MDLSNAWNRLRAESRPVMARARSMGWPVAASAAVIAALLALTFVWPTPYRDADGGGEGRGRVHRLTGRAETWDERAGDWREVSIPPSTEVTEAEDDSPIGGGPVTSHRGRNSARQDRGGNWWYVDEPADGRVRRGERSAGSGRESPIGGP